MSAIDLLAGALVVGVMALLVALGFIFPALGKVCLFGWTVWAMIRLTSLLSAD